jgi:putative phosphotransacetylase
MKNIKVKVEISARHVHLSQSDLEKLFGEGYQLKNIKDLSQEGEFAAEETVTLVGPKREFKNLRVVGPVRSATQVELAYTDAFSLGIDAPLRLSGDVAGSAGAKIIGPAGEADLVEGVIVAKRHLHVNQKEADELGLKTNDLVKVAVTGERGLVFDNVVVRIKPNFHMSVHIDTDEANASGCGKVCSFGQLILESL